MRGMLVVCIALLAMSGLQACTDKNGVPAGRSSTGNQPAQAPRQADQAATSPAATGEPATAETSTAPILPQDIPSETDDGQESVDPAMSGLQPMFKLGSAPPTAVTSARFKEGTHYQKIVPAQPTGVMPDK